MPIRRAPANDPAFITRTSSWPSSRAMCGANAWPIGSSLPQLASSTVTASRSIINYLRHHSRALIFTASLPPANTAGVLAALQVLQEDQERREQLWANTHRLLNGFRALGFDTGPSETPIVPILIGPLERTLLMWRHVFDAGIFTNPVVPPAVPPSMCRLRTSVMATHTPDQIDFAVETIGTIGKQLGVI